jgi:hypothetical protein
MTTMNWILPPFLDEYGVWKDDPSEDYWLWCGVKFMAAVYLADGSWDYAVVVFGEHGIECNGENWEYSVKDISWVAKISTPPKGE